MGRNVLVNGDGVPIGNNPATPPSAIPVPVANHRMKLPVPYNHPLADVPPWVRVPVDKILVPRVRLLDPRFITAEVMVRLFFIMVLIESTSCGPVANVLLVVRLKNAVAAVPPIVCALAVPKNCTVPALVENTWPPRVALLDQSPVMDIVP